MGKLRSMLDIFRPRRRDRTDADKAQWLYREAPLDRLVDGKVVGPTGSVTDFDRDQSRPKY